MKLNRSILTHHSFDSLHKSADYWVSF